MPPGTSPASTGLANPGTRKRSHGIGLLFFPSYWLFWRKCYGAGAIAMSISIASRLLSYPFMAAVNALIPTETATYNQAATILSENLSSIPPSAILMTLGGALSSLASSLFFGLLGTYIYKGRCIHKLDRSRPRTLRGTPRPRYCETGESTCSVPCWP